ncbi:hypothetical protein LuPra_03337 [Luteitalea pratensis]|uniref:Uncharacterized protein n=1 Tax=Luteitalea pratensis TaxID=1855912 RepID=A0A143PQM6_LUTPR|nr:hypothetical protein [Luteitalea pratensis]AMY10109.1 hypothetical protein LuPra_03337 [Luteitalea pratensis]
MSLLQPDAAASIGGAARRLHLYVVKSVTEVAAATRQAPRATGTSSRPGERVLLDEWREAHWTLRLRLREVAQEGQHGDLEPLYDAARRADNLLTEFYQLRAEHLARRLRAALIAGVPAAETHSPDRELVDDEEHVLLWHFRALAAEDRASLLRLASRLGDSRTLPRRSASPLVPAT